MTLDGLCMASSRVVAAGAGGAGRSGRRAHETQIGDLAGSDAGHDHGAPRMRPLPDAKQANAWHR